MFLHKILKNKRIWDMAESYFIECCKCNLHVVKTSVHAPHVTLKIWKARNFIFFDQWIFGTGKQVTNNLNINISLKHVFENLVNLSIAWNSEALSKWCCGGSY